MCQRAGTTGAVSEALSSSAVTEGGLCVPDSMWLWREQEHRHCPLQGTTWEARPRLASVQTNVKFQPEEVPGQVFGLEAQTLVSCVRERVSCSNLG